jgi:hypothetical protein
MYNNVCIILLIFLIVYLIYKISSNSCDCFSIGGNQKCLDHPYGSCLPPCKWNDSTKECEQRIIEKRSLKPKNPSQFIADINKAYNDPNSNGVFISIILDDGMDGSGSVLNKNIYTNTYSERSCTFGFIWNTDWLTANDGSLVECLFPTDAWTSYFNDTDCDPPTNFCEFAHTSGSNTPDRCSHGLYLFGINASKLKYLPHPTSCKQNKIYNFKEMNREKFENDKNCFTYINRKINNTPYVYDFNEGVFLKDLNNTSLNYHEGFEKLIELNKPLPSALLLVYSNNVDCTNNVNYINTLKAIKSSFTSDTIVVKAKYNNVNNSIISFDDDHTTLGEIS